MSFKVGFSIQIYLNVIRVVRKKQVCFFQNITLDFLTDRTNDRSNKTENKNPTPSISSQLLVICILGISRATEYPSLKKKKDNLKAVHGLNSLEISLQRPKKARHGP